LGARSLEIRAPHVLQAATLPLHHRDPFDRMLIAQAQLEDLVILSAIPCLISTTFLSFGQQILEVGIQPIEAILMRAVSQQL
jgi:hypothetical protein